VEIAFLPSTILTATLPFSSVLASIASLAAAMIVSYAFF
jgi:hypothetical protein